MITRYLYRNPQMVWLIVAAITVAGVSCFLMMPRLEDPILKQRVGVVTLTFVGADASEIESTAIVPIEEWLGEFAEIKRVRSNIRSNVANVVIELADRVNEPSDVWSSIERRLRANSGRLPVGCSEPELTVFPLKAFAAIIAITPDAENADSLRTEHRLARELKTRLLNLEGTESIEIFGEPKEELVVRVSPQTLSANGISTASIAQSIEASEPVPGGNIRQGGKRLSLEVKEAGDLVRRLEQLPIQVGGQQATLLQEIAEVSIEENETPNELALIDRQRSIVLGAMVDNQYRVDVWTRDLENVLAQFSADFPGSYAVKPLFLQSEQVQQRMGNLLQNLWMSGAAVVLVVFFFMGWRCMLVVAISLPLSACLVICGLRVMGIPIHQMSVTGLIVSLGLLIDNAIVMVEEVRSRLYAGTSRGDAIAESTRHLGMPLLGSTLTTILAFLPIATLPGPSGEFVGSLAISVILSISASLLLAVTIIPPMVFYFGVHSENQTFLNYGFRANWIRGLYKRSLQLTFRWPVFGLALGVVFPAMGFVLANQLPKQFFPATDRAQIQIELELGAASDVNAVAQAVDRAQAIVQGNDHVTRQDWYIGGSAPTFYYNVVPRRRSTPNYAQAMINLAGTFDIDSVVNDIQTEVDAKVLDARVVVRKLEQGPPFDAPIEIRVLGDELTQLEGLGNEIRKQLKAHPAVTHTRSDLGDKTLKFALDVDSNLALRNGISDREISKFLYTSLEGSSIGSFQHHGLSINGRVVVDFSDRSVVDTLLGLPIPVRPSSVTGSQRGGSRGGTQRPPKVTPVSLGTVANIELDADVGAIVRLNGQRVNEVKAYLKAGVLPSQVLEEFKANFGRSDFRLPQGYRVEIGGEDEKRTQAITTLISNVTIIVVLAVIVLVAILGKIRFAIIIAGVASLAMGLGPLALYSFGFPFGFMAIVGTMGLIGVAINDSIVVLAAIREKHVVRGKSKAEQAEGLAEIVIGSTRHILATTFTTMIGFMPLIIDGGRFWPPLAIVIAAGVGGATLLALYFTPSMLAMLGGFGDGGSYQANHTVSEEPSA